ncbi:hypothetical protein ACFVH6_37875 [Spirillospora sp. NPDC127200]
MVEFAQDLMDDTKDFLDDGFDRGRDVEEDFRDLFTTLVERRDGGRRRGHRTRRRSEDRDRHDGRRGFDERYDRDGYHSGDRDPWRWRSGSDDDLEDLEDMVNDLRCDMEVLVRQVQLLTERLSVTSGRPADGSKDGGVEDGGRAKGGTAGKRSDQAG